MRDLCIEGLCEVHERHVSRRGSVEVVVQDGESMADVLRTGAALKKDIAGGAAPDYLVVERVEPGT